MKTVIKKNFFERPALIVARDLLGKYLVRKEGKNITAVQITEVEAYDGPHDMASHAYRGKTARNEIMFGKAGYFYIYLVYGMHWMLNVVTGESGYPAAILIRGIHKINGPARLTKFLHINKSHNGKAAKKKNGLWFEDRGEIINGKRIIKTSRIGVNYAGPIWSKKLYRFVLK